MSPAVIEFKLPSLGADMDEGKLLEWLIKPGDTVKRGQVVAVVDTTKAAIEIESWQEGVVQELLIQPEQKIPVGTVMALFRAPRQSGSEAAQPPPVDSRPQASAPAPSPAPAQAQPPAPAATAAPRLETHISPAARRRAAELQLDLASLDAGSGPQGAITSADVERAAAARSARPAKTATTGTVPGTSATAPMAAAERAAEMRRTIAAAMSRSKREIPHYYLAEPIPMRRAVDWLAAENAARAMTERLLMAVPLLKAVAICLARFPELNGWYVDGEFRPSAAQHLGVAIALRQGGLVAPAIHDVANLSLSELMTSLGDLIQRTRAGRLRSSELSDATVTVSSLGEQGVESLQGVIYPPQVALVGFGRLHERAWAADGALMAMPVITASLAADHRVSDGHRGARFLAALRELLQDPDKLK